MVEKENKVTIGITIDPDVLKTIDEKRGLTKRSTFINNALKEYFKGD